MTGMPLNPFEGMTRLRPPGTDLATACDGGMPLDNALGAFFFYMLHDSYPHDCLPAKMIDETRKRAYVLVGNKPDGWFAESERLLTASSAKSAVAYAFEEWAYLPDHIAFVFELMAGQAAEHTQRWIAWGNMDPYQIRYVGGSIVERVPATIAAWGDPDSPKRAVARERVLELMNSVPEEARTS